MLRDIDRVNRVRRSTIALPVVAAASAAVLAAVVWAAWPSGGHPGSSMPRALVYPAYSACLLTDNGGPTSAQAQPAWTGMLAAAAAASVKVSYLPTTGTPDAANVQSYLNTLLGQRCDVVVAVGEPETAAVAARAAAYPAAHFVVVGAASSASNVAPVAGGGDVAAGVRRLILAAHAGRFDGWASGAL